MYLKVIEKRIINPEEMEISIQGERWIYHFLYRKGKLVKRGLTDLGARIPNYPPRYIYAQIIKKFWKQVVHEKKRGRLI